MTNQPINQLTNKPIRDGFGTGLLKLGATNPKVLALTADLRESVRMHHFAEKYPEHFFELGIAEQNMAAVAAGLGLEGMIPFIGTFACFQPYRNLDQIRTSICIMNSNVKIVSSHAGFSYPADGIQIQALEDVGIMRLLPNMTVIVPADAAQAESLTLQAADYFGPVYLRLGRSETPNVSDEDPILGKAQVIKKGGDVTIIACGYMVNQALLAAEQLAEANIHARVINMHTIKPLDAEAVIAAAHETKAIITIEEHQITGGLGSAVAECLAAVNIHTKLKMLGVHDAFGDTAETVEQLWALHGLDVDSIVAAVNS
jgi:transketolase